MRACVSVMLLVLMAAAVAAGDPDGIVSGRPDGTYRLLYKVRDGVYGDGRSRIISRGGDEEPGDWRCGEVSNGPARLEVRLAGGEVRDLELRIGGEWREARRGEIDLGEQDPAAVAAWLLHVAATARGDVAEDAVFGAAVACDAEIWPGLLAIARDRDRPDEVREDVLFWLGYLAGEKALDALSEVARADDESAELREHAVWALSQLDEESSLPILLDLARETERPEVMRAALFGLAQMDAPEVVDLFEEILVKR